MTKVGVIGLIIALGIFPPISAQQLDVDAQAVHSSKHWLDLDCVGDRIIGHRLDIHLPEVGEAPFPVVIAIDGSG